MRAGVAVAANNCHTRLGESHFGTDHVHDSLLSRADIEQLNAEFLAVAAQGFNLLSGDRILNAQALIHRGGYIVVDGGSGQLGAPDFAPGGAQTLKGLRRGDFVDEMQINIERRRLALRMHNGMRVPYLFEQCFRFRHRSLIPFVLPWHPQRRSKLRLYHASFKLRDRSGGG